MAMIHQNTAFLQSQHQQNMATWRGMAASHQAHMASLHASHDAHNAAWQSQQSAQSAAHSAQMHSSDDSHRRSINAITEERTVIDSEGNTYQVADGYDRYFRRRSDGAWIGTPSHRDLRDIPGVNPDDYEEVKIRCSARRGSEAAASTGHGALPPPATVLNDGRVLATGGFSTSSQASSELYGLAH